MASKTILLVDGSSLSKPFFHEILEELGSVLEFNDAAKALTAINRGVAIDVAVLRYRLSVTPLIQGIRRMQPKASIVAYGAPRADTPLGVDEYLREPILSAEMEGVVARYLSARKADRMAQWAGVSLLAAAERRNANLARHRPDFDR